MRESAPPKRRSRQTRAIRAGHTPRYIYPLYISVALLTAALFVAINFAFSPIYAFVFLGFGISVFLIFFKGKLLLYVLVVVFLFPIPIVAGPIHVTPMDVIIFMMFLSVCFNAATRKRLIFPSGLYLIASTLIILSAIISSLNAAHIMTAFPEIIQFIYFVVIIPFTIMNLATSAKHMLNVLKFFALVMSLQAVLVITQFYFMLAGNPVIRNFFQYANRGNEEGIVLRSYGSIGPALGVFLSVAIAAMLMVSLTKKATLAAKLASIPGFLLCLYAIACAGMRSGLGLIAVLIPGFTLFTRRYLLTVFILFCFGIGSLVLLTSGKDVYPFKLFFGHGGNRETDISDAMERFRENPLLGLGPQQYIRKRAPNHPTGVENEMVRRLVEGGIVGGATYIFWLAIPPLLAAIAAIRTKTEELRDISITGLLSFVVFIIIGFSVSDIFEGGHGHLMLMIVGFILAAFKELESELTGRSESLISTIRTKAKASRST